nr:iron-containing alcohol dehydrogenase [Eubacterium sp.]
MKALIFNSGTGSRMGSMTEHGPKCLLQLKTGESIFARQLRILAECGITEVIVTTGEYEQDLQEESKKVQNITVMYVNNPEYATTNYIYSMYLASEYLDDDILMLHGDLVFNKELVQEIQSDKNSSVCLINKNISQPPKDFKGRISEEGYLREVSVNIFDEDCYALQPLYKLSKHCVTSWLDEIRRFVEQGITNVYAENALNLISDKLNICAMSYEKHYINEIDTPEDFVRVSREISLVESGVYFSICAMNQLWERYKAKRPFVVMGRHLAGSELDLWLDSLEIKVYKYFGVMENPEYECVMSARQAFEEHDGDMLISVGGGSAIDIAKGIKYYLMQKEESWKGLVHIAIPTTAGSGSEATHFAVMYRDGIKDSLANEALLPQHAILDVRMLYSLSEEQRKISLLDAFCHSIESILSRNATDESRRYAVCAINIISQKYQAFCDGETEVFQDIFVATHLAGKAIDISKTTVGHAMSYVLTSLYGIKHGQAVAMCLIQALKYMEENNPDTTELAHLRELLSVKEESIAQYLMSMYRTMDLPQPDLERADAVLLAKEVNVERLSNSVVSFSEKDLQEIYQKVKE